MVIVIPGAVLFSPGKTALLASAQARLNDVAQVLAKQDPNDKIVVEGHTDSTGNPEASQDLSQKRADAIRSYLGSHGIAADRVTAAGVGEMKPIADNSTAEGRSSNRRIEIIVQQGEPSAPPPSENTKPVRPPAETGPAPTEPNRPPSQGSP
jgi:outer membrane protein OmpA-like peptidoglycan-associated protein